MHAGHRLYALFHLIAVAGLRRGGERALPLDAATVAVLREHRDQQRTEADRAKAAEV